MAFQIRSPAGLRQTGRAATFIPRRPSASLPPCCVGLPEWRLSSPPRSPKHSKAGDHRESVALWPNSAARSGYSSGPEDAQKRQHHSAIDNTTRPARWGRSTGYPPRRRPTVGVNTPSSGPMLRSSWPRESRGHANVAERHCFSARVPCLLPVSAPLTLHLRPCPRNPSDTISHSRCRALQPRPESSRSGFWNCWPINLAKIAAL